MRKCVASKLFFKKYYLPLSVYYVYHVPFTYLVTSVGMSCRYVMSACHVGMYISTCSSTIRITFLRFYFFSTSKLQNQCSKTNPCQKFPNFTPQKVEGERKLPGYFSMLERTSISIFRKQNVERKVIWTRILFENANVIYHKFQKKRKSFCLPN